MKKGYRNLLIYEIIIFIILILNSFVSSILDSTKMIIFLLLMLASFHLFLGLEKDNHRYTKDIIMEESIFIIIFFLIYYLSGIFFGFAKVENYYTLKSMTNIIIPLIIIVFLKEIIRYQMLLKTADKKLLRIITTILFIFLDLSTSLLRNMNYPIYDKFIYIAITVLPTISANIAYSYISYKTGYKPVIYIRLIIELFMYLLPFIPNPNQYIYSIVWLFVPFFLLRKIYLFYQKEKDEEILREYHKKKIGTLIIPIIITIFLVYITSGYFKYYALAIASASMSPNIHKGDVVIVEKKQNLDEVAIGQVIAFKYNNIIVVHRLVEKLKYANEYYLYTKGDANDDLDGYPVTKDMFIGVVNIKIPYIGLPTVWLNEK